MVSREHCQWLAIYNIQYIIHVVNCLIPEQEKMRSQLVAQFMPFFWLIARILTLCDKKYRILTFRDKKYRILTFRESYLTVLQQNNAEACSFVISLPNAQLQLIYCCTSLLWTTLKNKEFRVQWNATSAHSLCVYVYVSWTFPGYFLTISWPSWS